MQGFSRKRLAETGTAARDWLARWTAGKASEDELAAALPSVGFSISCALAELDDRLPAQAEYRSVPLCTGDPDEALAHLVGLPGAKVAKSKVGMYEAVRDSLTVNMLLSGLPDLRLRLDANRRWTRGRALQFACYPPSDCLLSRFDFLEEPCASTADLLAFAAQTGIPIAWDESAREPGFTLRADPAFPFGALANTRGDAGAGYLVADAGAIGAALVGCDLPLWSWAELEPVETMP